MKWKRGREREGGREGREGERKREGEERGCREEEVECGEVHPQVHLHTPHDDDVTNLQTAGP